MRQYSRVRRRDGAYQWGIYRDIEVANRFVEIFLVGRTGLQLRRSRTEKRDFRVLQVVVLAARVRLICSRRHRHQNHGEN